MPVTPNSTNTITGIAREVSNYTCVTYFDDLQLSDGLTSGAIKNAAVIACSDMGWLVPYVCSDTRVELSLFQNFGHRHDTGGFAETLAASGFEHVIVYGHSPCDYTRFLAKSARQKTLDDKQISAEQNFLNQLYQSALEKDSEGDWEKVGQYKVLSEMKNLLENPVVSAKAQIGNLKVHGWFYKTSQRKLEIFDPHKELFTAQLTQMSKPPVMKFAPDDSHIGEAGAN